MADTLATKSSCELVIKKSRFLGAVEPVRDRAEALDIVASLRRLHPEATHVCWALMAGGHSAAHDDGEPGGMAGRPMLEVLRLQGLEGVLATVVRYYGGVKLGAGGLVRAYTDAVVQALKDAPREPIIAWQGFSLTLPYKSEGDMRRLLESFGGRIDSVTHENDVVAVVSIQAHQVVQFLERLKNITAGAASAQALEPRRRASS